MKVKSIAECSFGAFCNTFDRHLAIFGLENQFLIFFLSGRLRQVLLLISIVNLLNCNHARKSLYSKSAVIGGCGRLVDKILYLAVSKGNILVNFLLLKIFIANYYQINPAVYLLNKFFVG